MTTEKKTRKRRRTKVEVHRDHIADLMRRIEEEQEQLVKAEQAEFERLETRFTKQFIAAMKFDSDEYEVAIETLKNGSMVEQMREYLLTEFSIDESDPSEDNAELTVNEDHLINNETEVVTEESELSNDYGYHESEHQETKQSFGWQ